MAWSERAAVVHLLVLVLSLTWRLPATSAQLSPDYYVETCPNVEGIVRSAFIRQMNLIRIVTAPASLLRAVFHDCIVGSGCDGSILLDTQGEITDEKDAEKNLGIGNLDVIDAIKSEVESECPGIVSCADILAMVGRDAVSFAGGNRFPIHLGRKDSTFASTDEAQARIIPGDGTVSDVLLLFNNMGLDTQESVALLGAHTLGVSHCSNIENRLYPEPDETLSQPTNAAFYLQLRAQCPDTFRRRNAVVANDPTNTIFDSQYFRAATTLERGLLTIDDAFAKDERTAPFMQEFASNTPLFFQVFARAYDKMTQFGVLSDLEGEVRQDCHFVNSVGF